MAEQSKHISHEEHVHENDHSHEKENGLIGQLKHFFTPHSHDTADSIDDAVTGSKEGIKTVKISLVGLSVTAILQLVVALASGSVALLADSIHNFADATTAIPLFLAFHFGKKTATKRYTYGYGRAEDLAGVFVIALIMLSTFVAAYQSIMRFFHPQTPTHLIFVGIAAIIGFLGNELVAKYRIKAGQRIGSAALIADGYHARTDGFASLSVLLAAIGVALGFPLIDPIIGIVVSIVILFTLKETALQIWYRLMDAVDPKLVHSLEHAAKDTEGVMEVSTVRLRWIGHNLHAEANITADCKLQLDKAHKIAEEVQHSMLHAVPKLASVSVHIEPCVHNGEKLHAEHTH